MRAILNAYPVSKLATGMYFTINGDGYNKVWMVAGYATEYNKGSNDGIIDVKGWTLIPREVLFRTVMNNDNTTIGAYAGSLMHTVTLANYGNTLKGILGSTLQQRSVLLSNTMDATKTSHMGYTGCSSNNEWTEAYCTLPTEVQIFGANSYGNVFDTGEGCFKLPVFNFINHIYYAREDFWLRDVVSQIQFSRAGYSGNVGVNNATTSRGVRPIIYVA